MKHQRYWLGCLGGENNSGALDHSIECHFTRRQLLSHKMA